MKTLLAFPFALALTLAAVPASSQTQTGGKPLCPLVGGNIDTANVAFPYGCAATPNVLTVKMYRIGLCKSNPAPTNGIDANGDPTILSTVALDYSSCTFALDSATAVLANLAVGNSVALGTALTFSIGTYPYGVMIVGNANSITSTQSFSTVVTGGAASTGTFCSTNGGSVYSSAASSLDVKPEPGGNTYLTRCGNAAPASSATTVVLDTFDNQAAPALQPVIGTTAIAPIGAPAGDRLYGFLRQSDGVTLATGLGAASTGTRLVGVYKFGTPAKVTSATTNLSVNSLVTGGIGFGGGGSGGGSPAYLSRILPGIFIAYVTAN